MIDTIQVGDARVLCKGIKPGSLDAIFTDPVYGNLNDYGWLGEVATTTLRVGGKLLVWCSSNKQFAIKDILDNFLTFAYPLFYVVKAKMGKLYAYHIHTWTTPILVYYKKEYENPMMWVPDTYISSARPSSAYKWNKNLGVVEYYLNGMFEKGSLVWDPFCGYGAVPVACVRNGFHYIASEIDPEVANVAIQRASSERAYLY